MKEITQIAIDYLQGKEIYPQVRRLLSQVFIICLTSYFYIIICGNYQWYSITEYKLIIDYIVSGKFIVPFSIYVIVYFCVRVLETGVFYFTSHYKANKLQRAINEFSISQVKIRFLLNSIYRVSKKVIPIDLTKELLVNVVKENQNDINMLIKTLNEQSSTVQKNFEINFNMLFRAFLTILFVHNSIPNFNPYLFVICISILILSMYILTKAFHVIQVAPALIFKINEGILTHSIIPQNEISASSSEKFIIK